MIDLLPWAPFVPAALPLLLAALALLGRSARVLGLLALVGLLCAAVPLLPIPGVPRQSPAWRWATIGGAAVPMQLSLAGARGAMSFLLLLAGALGLWSVARLGWGRPGLPPGAGSLADGVDHQIGE